ncbi:RagB/SusD family nutrient uptake outer membrane protein [Pedobacter sp. AW31-3R]|uniref:RagB/SusD family nutrient uptake outer membrane protein n=1 Tax=Pedobacter sp. AW31-3R TaxID=3445781 RepID=UPI003FA00C57
MKHTKIYQFILLSSFLFFCLSCKKWTDVNPSTRIKEEEFFSKESGFKDLLAGIYIKMGDPSTYGRETTFGFIDVIGQQYDLSTNPALDQTYPKAEKAGYTDVDVQRLINAIWSNNYNCIANTNLLLQGLNSADQSIFQAGNFNIIKGEALGLRAFLHFDLLRLFGTTYPAGGANLSAIPYVTKYGNDIPKRITAAEVIALILADLDEAESLLKEDPIATGRTVSGNEDNGYLLNRKLKFNYYAVLALKARVYLWAGQSAKALEAAKKVIEKAEVTFPWVLNTALTGSDTNKDRTFTTEYIFGLYQNQMLANTTGFITDNSQRGLTITAGTLNSIYPRVDDIRRSYLIRSNSFGIYSDKLFQPSTNPDPNLTKRMPIIRIPEMYYIAAEAVLEIDKAQALTYLNKVRNIRGENGIIQPTANTTEIMSEISKEYRKEFFSEGQFFYYNKRLNNTAVPGFEGVYDTRNYVLPLPPNEIQFGSK